MCLARNKTRGDNLLLNGAKVQFKGAVFHTNYFVKTRRSGISYSSYVHDYIT